MRKLLKLNYLYHLTQKSENLCKKLYILKKQDRESQPRGQKYVAIVFESVYQFRCILFILHVLLYSFAFLLFLQHSKDSNTWISNLLPAPKNGEQTSRNTEGAESTSSQQSLTSKETSPANTPGNKRNFLTYFVIFVLKKVFKS